MEAHSKQQIRNDLTVVLGGAGNLTSGQGSNDKITVQNAFSATQNQLDAIYVGNQVLNASHISSLVTALDAFTPDSNGIFTSQQRIDMLGVIDSYFQPV